MNSQFYGVITAREEFLYPDSVLSPLPDSLFIPSPLNGMPGIQLLLQTKGNTVSIELDSFSSEESETCNSPFLPEFFQMQAIPVEYNTGDGISQGGSMVLENPPSEKPGYASRLAPFFVYDCLIPNENNIFSVTEERAAIYICLKPVSSITPGIYSFSLKAHMDESVYTCRISIHIYDVSIPEDTFPVTNWFSLEAIRRFHNVDSGTEKFLSVVKQYAQSMRRIHQNIFFIELDETCVISRNPYAFDFEYLTPVISCFFEAGMKKMELGTLLSRGFLPNGKPDMYTDKFTCSMAKEIPFDTLEGYTITVTYIKSLADYLKKHGWENNILFHIHDEPDIHYKDQETLNARKRQYYLAASILRKYLPEVQIIEAVDSAEFRGGIDIWVPGTAGYEKRKNEFDTLISLGETVWNYVCCGPEGYWLNRFLDYDLIKNRLLFWGFARNRISGYLHWGFNQFPEDMNPYKGTSCPNHTGIGTNFPCGDSFLIYPGKDGPNLGMRMETQRRGAEDAALWQLLRKKDEALHDQLLDEVFTNNYTYDSSPEKLETIYEKLLENLE